MLVHRLSRAIGLSAVLTLAAATPVLADATAFLGATTTPDNRAVKGIAVEAGLLFLGLEFEYASTSDDPTAGAPALKTGSANLLLQTPLDVFGFQAYATAGVGIYRETLDPAYRHTGVAPNLGAGVKLSLAGPLRLRVDYRVFKLGSGARYSPTHRVYAGLNLRF